MASAFLSNSNLKGSKVVRLGNVVCRTNGITEALMN